MLIKHWSGVFEGVVKTPKAGVQERGLDWKYKSGRCWYINGFTVLYFFFQFNILYCYLLLSLPYLVCLKLISTLIEVQHNKIHLSYHSIKTLRDPAPSYLLDLLLYHFPSTIHLIPNPLTSWLLFQSSFPPLGLFGEKTFSYYLTLTHSLFFRRAFFSPLYQLGFFWVRLIPIGPEDIRNWLVYVTQQSGARVVSGNSSFPVA